MRRERRAGSRKPVGYPRRYRSPEAGLVLLALASLLLLGLFRDAASAVPLLPFLAALILFVVPGALLTRLFVGASLPFVARLPVAFVSSVGLFSLLAVPMFIRHSSLSAYLHIVVGIVAVSLALLVVTILLGKPAVDGQGGGVPGDKGGWLWIPFVVLGTILAFVSSQVSHSPSEDTWLYLTHVQDYVGRDRLSLFPPYAPGEVTSFTRITLDGWLVELAALARVSGLEPARMLLFYAAPTLVVMSLLSFYTLARTLLGSASRALWAGCLLALFFLVTLGSTPSTPGAEFVGRLTEDKFAARYLLLPVALCLATLFLQKRKLGYLVLLAFVCWSAPTVHPLGWVNVGICLGGLGLVHLLVDLRRGKSWVEVGALGVAAVGVAVPPVAYLLWKGISVSSLMGGSDPNRTAKQLLSAEEQQHLLILGDGSYIMHPSLLLSPVLLGAYLLGVPFLLWRVKRSVPAQLLLGVLIIVPALLYTPPVATFLANLVDPWNLWRLSWPLFLGAILTLGWAGAEAIAYAQARLDGSRVSRRLAPLLPLVLVLTLALAAAPAAINRVRATSGVGETPLNRTSCMDPIFPWMQETVKTTVMVMAPDAENSCIPAHVTLANVMTYRSTGLLAAQNSAQEPSGSQISPIVVEAKKFFKSRTVDAGMVQTLQQNAVGYLLLPASSQLNAQLPHLPGFLEMDAPGHRYRLYRVEREKLTATPLIEANGYFNQRKWREAESAYAATLQTGNQDERFSALLGLGQTYTKLKLFEDAELAYESAAELSPQDPTPYMLMAQNYVATGDTASATEAADKAVELSPGDIGLRLALGKLLLKAGEEQKAVEQYQAAVKAYPRVPDYRVQLGEALGLAGDLGAADRELKRAVSLNPLSARINESVAEAYKSMGNVEEAKAYRQRAKKL